MGRDRQERKLKKARRTESDRDQSLDYKGATRLDTPEEAREMNQMNPK
ncbi:YpzI family protein [Bacillus sp. JJ1566]